MLRVENVYKQFDNGFLALDAVNLEVHPGEIVSLVGTSGCGKSTLLRIISGLDFPSEGDVWIDNELLVTPHPEVGMIFQEPRLMPWLTVKDNVRFGLERTADSEAAIATTLAKVGLADFANALPRQLSGGMAQRVAIARALITQPSILLLDEPFSALDAFTRTKLQDHLLHIWEYDRPTMLLVTHDIEEALVLSDRIIVMRSNPGRIHREFVLDLPRPRKRTDTHLQQWKERLLNELDLSLVRSLTEV
ncbi:ABC transporter ATP-binding protein [Leptolyngbya sp. FACHB-541]|uniref:ABC transporter ATP-binding protein n=1 Tax=Leptolyngbya sp. FACHB-541 TaxID=2692810 RepID=UPI001681DAFA|nr:ABC transporter ATP-binding protein [Leptolyngbya sp. FACHB-541]MBD1995450.1 ABC transporter ATP-binding protein [Leptolyngbya sp. FACHB-541]